MLVLLGRLEWCLIAPKIKKFYTSLSIYKWQVVFAFKFEWQSILSIFFLSKYFIHTWCALCMCVDQCLHLNNSLNEICGVRLGSISFEKTFWSTFGWMDFQWRGGNVGFIKNIMTSVLKMNESLWVWNDMRVSNWWQNVILGELTLYLSN